MADSRRVYYSKPAADGFPVLGEGVEPTDFARMVVEENDRLRELYGALLEAASDTNERMILHASKDVRRKCAQDALQRVIDRCVESEER